MVRIVVGIGRFAHCRQEARRFVEIEVEAVAVIASGVEDVDIIERDLPASSG